MKILDKCQLRREIKIYKHTMHRKDGRTYTEISKSN